MTPKVFIEQKERHFALTFDLTSGIPLGGASCLGLHSLSFPSPHHMLTKEPLIITQQVLIQEQSSVYCVCHFPSSAFVAVLPAFQAHLTHIQPSLQIQCD